MSAEREIAVDAGLAADLMHHALDNSEDETGAIAALGLAAANIAVHEECSREDLLDFMGRMYDGAAAAKRRSGS